jgi:hypothetical protein
VVYFLEEKALFFSINSDRENLCYGAFLDVWKSKGKSDSSIRDGNFREKKTEIGRRLMMNFYESV